PRLRRQRLLPLLPERFPVPRQKARSIVVIECRFLRQSLPDPVILAVGGLPLQLPPARTYLHHGAWITLGQALIDVLRSPVIAPIALQPRGEARQRLLELCATKLAHQGQNRLHLRLPRRTLWDSALAVEQFERLPQLRPQVTEMIIPADLLCSRGFGGFIRRHPLVDHCFAAAALQAAALILPRDRRQRLTVEPLPKYRQGP